MSLTMHSASMVPMRHGLLSLSGLLSKAQAHCEARKIDPQALLTARLFPDMFPLTRQVQIASDTAKGAAARLAGIEIPKFDDTETSFAELHARIDRTVAFIDGIPAAQFDGSDARQVVIKLTSRSLEFTGAEYLTGWALPNFYFHVTTAYALLRHAGVEIGKSDFLGK